MSYVVVVLLSFLWLGFFLPSLLQARRTSSPYASATTFQESLRRLSGPSQAAAELPPEPEQISHRPQLRRAASPATARRRDVLAVLGAAVAAGGVVWLGFDGWADWAPLPPLVALAGYVAWLRRLAVRRAAQRRSGVAAEEAGGFDRAAAEEAGGSDGLVLDAAPDPLPLDDGGLDGDPVVVLSVRRRELVGAHSDRVAG